MTDQALFRWFHENSKLSKWEWDVLLRIQSVNEEGPFHVGDRPPVDSSRLERVELPRPMIPDDVSLRETLARRRSADGFGRDPLSAEQLSGILHYSAGYNGALSVEGTPVQPLRPYPSPGALYPNLVLVEARSVSGLEPGSYYFDVDAHQLGKLDADVAQVSSAVTTDGPDDCSARIWIACSFERVTFKYGERGYRFALLEAGHIAQNIVLCAVAMGLAARPVGGFFDDAVRVGLGLDWSDIAPLYAVAIGTTADHTL